MTPPLWQKVKNQRAFGESERGEWKSGLKAQHSKTKIMASGSITSWQIDGETGEPVANFIFMGSKITADGDCRDEIKRYLLLGRKVMTNLDSILKSKDITLPTKVHLVKVMVFPVTVYGCESWTVKKGERWRTDAFELCCWRRLLRVPWTTRISNQPILKETSPGCSLEGLMLKLKLQYFGHPMQRTDSFDKTLMHRKIEGRRRRGWQRVKCLDASQTQWIWVWVNSGSWWWTGRPVVHGVTKSWTRLSDWTEWACRGHSWISHHVPQVLIFPLVETLGFLKEDRMRSALSHSCYYVRWNTLCIRCYKRFYVASRHVMSGNRIILHYFYRLKLSLITVYMYTCVSEFFFKQTK